MRTFSIAILLTFFELTILSVSAQTLPVGMPVYEDYYRRGQMLGTVDSSTSFTIRPLFPAFLVKNADTFSSDSILPLSKPLNLPGNTFFAKEINLHLLPLIQQTQLTTHHPYGWNDGLMIPAKGFQSMISGGIYLQYKNLSLQLKPEVVWAQNSGFTGFPSEYQPETWATTYDYYYNLIDAPERFGTKAYTRFNWGQSSLRFTLDPVSIGLSNENLWWGPGRRSSLLMSNTAPGFKHLSLNTVRPVHTPVGSFEAQLIMGRLENSGFPPPGNDRLLYGVPIYKPKNDQSRNLSGMVLTYQPKWISGLFLGYARTSQTYKAKGFENPLLFKRLDYDKIYDEEGDYEQYLSVFARWLFPAVHGELYFEYGLNNHPYSLTARKSSTLHSRAYTFGLRKFVPGKSSAQYLVDLEISQLSGPADYLSKGGESWYVHNRVRQGYTHEGQVLGAGIGVAGNLQSLTISRINGLNRIGLQLERYVHNNDLLFYNIQDVRRHYVDISAGLSGEHLYKNFILNGSLSLIKSLNYHYYLQNVPGVFWVKGRDKINVQAKLGIGYRF